MNTKLILSSLICGLCFTVAAQANTKTTQDPQTQKYQQVCKGKKQGDAVSFAYKGVIFNGVCENNDAGKLAFQPPAPPAGTMPETQNRMSQTQSEPRPVSAPMPVDVPPMQPAPPVSDSDVEQTTP